MHPLLYAHQTVPPHRRVGALVAHTPELGWAFSLMHDFSNADVYMVGGTVRDAIRGIVPHELHTLVRDVSPAKLTRWLSRRGAVERTGDGVWAFTPSDAPRVVEVALPRVRIPDASTHHADFLPDEKLRLEDDLAGRDFSVNAMAYSLRDGRLTDPYGGLHDLNRYHSIRPIRSAHDHFGQEPGSLVRALRLATQLGATLETKAWHALASGAHRIHASHHDDNGLARYSVPRHELGRDVLLGLQADALHFVRLLRESGLFRHVTPELGGLDDIRHADGENGWTKTERLLAALRDPAHLRLYGIVVPTATLLLVALVYFLEERSNDSLRSLITRLHLHAAADPRLVWNHEDAMWLLDHAHQIDEHNPEHEPLSRIERFVAGVRGAELLALVHAAHIARGSHDAARDRIHGWRDLARPPRARRSRKSARRPACRAHFEPPLGA